MLGEGDLVARQERLEVGEVLLIQEASCRDLAWIRRDDRDRIGTILRKVPRGV